MYRCVTKVCDENLDLTSHQDIILHGREKEFAFRPRILLACGHSVCEVCIYTAVTSKKEEFIRCDDCGKTTTFSSQTVQTIKYNQPRTKPSVRWNEDCENDLIYEAFSIGAAFNSGRISISATPCVDLDESIVEIHNLPSHSYRDEAEVLAIRGKISNASESFKSAVNDGIKMYTSCGKSLKFLFETKNAVNKQFVSTKEAIRKRFHILHGLLQLEEDNLIRELVKSKETTVNSLQIKEKNVYAVRNSLKSLILRSPQYAHIQSNNPFKSEIEAYGSEPFRLDAAPDLPNHLASLNRPHDDLHQAIKKLVDFRKAVRFDVNCVFTGLNSSAQPTPHIQTASEQLQTRTKPTIQKPLSYINYIKSQLVSIRDIKDSGYFAAHLPSNENVANALAEALIKWCSSFRHPPCITKIKPESDVVVWHDQKGWTRAKFKGLIEDNRQSQKENYCLLNTNLTSNKVEVSLIDYADEIYKLPIENLRESCSQLTDPTTYPPLSKVWKCRLKNIQPLGKEIRNGILKFCASGIKVRLLILSEPIDGIYDVDIAHDICDLVNPQPTLIEYLIYAKLAKLKESKDQSSYPYPLQDTVLQYQNPRSLKVDKIYSVDLTFIRDPFSFYVVIAQERKEIDSIEKKINELYATKESSTALRLYYPRIWVPCAARCELFWDRKKKRGKMFHRGYIVPPSATENLATQMSEFLAVDYGEKVLVNNIDLRILPDCYVSALPRSMIHCSLDGIAPLDSRNWSQNAIKAFMEFFQATDTPTTITVKKQELKMHNVVLTLHATKVNHPYGNINDILIQDNFAVKKIEETECVDLARQENRLASSNNHRVNNSRNDFNCYNLLRDMVHKSKLYNLGAIDSLIPVVITAFTSPESIYVQINTPEVQMDLNNYMRRLNESYDTDITQKVVGPMQGFDVGQQCIYLFRPEHGYQTFWRRGLITAFLGRAKNQLDQQSNCNGDSTDPRQLKKVTADSLYKIRDRDYGITVDVERRNMLTLPPASPYLVDGEKCVQVYIPGVKHTDENWTSESIDFCNRKIREHPGKFFLKMEDDLPPTLPEKLPVDCIYLAVEIPDACLPSEDHYYSLRFQLIESGNALITSDSLHFEKEIKIDDDSVYANIKIPHSIRDEGLLSSLRSSFYTENEIIEVIKYMEAKKPTVDEFDAICTHIDDGPSIWFTVREEEPNESSIGTINKKILQTIMKQEKLAPFKGAAEIGRACTVYNDFQWYRAEIKASVGNKMIVCHVDSGSTKDYFINEMSNAIFCEGIPKLALVGRLDRCVPFVVEHQVDAVSRLRTYLTKNLIGKKIKVKWENFGSPREMLISVVVEDSGRDLKNLLLNLDLVRESSSGLEDLPQYIRTSIELMQDSEFNFANHQYSMDTFYPVIIADFVKENYLYLQLTAFDRPTCLDEEEINANYERYKVDEETINTNVQGFSHALEFSVGNSCCAKWNGEWFRGIVSGVVIPKIKYEVFFVDWGNTDIIELTNMRVLPDTLSLRGNPIFGFFVRLSNIKPARQGAWTQRLYETMKLTVDQAASVNTDFLVKFKSTSMPFDVELWIADRDQQPVELFLSDLINEGFLETC